jgi:ribosomal protein S18 acetylase RimI-like enzyme
MTAFQIRDVRLPQDKAQLLEFILGSQQFEKSFEPNRRLDDDVAREYFESLCSEVSKKGGRILVAEDERGSLLGWAVALAAEDEIFVADAERRFAYLSELYVAEAARGAGIGQALIRACEAWARSAGYSSIRIGVLSGNTRADRIYRAAGYAPYALTLRKYL